MKEMHGLRGSSEYNSWRGIKQRILNPNSQYYDRYGGRGLGMEAAWIKSFSAFYKDMGPKPSPLHSIERIDNNRGYYRGNCRWATKSEQAYNRSQHPNKLGHKGVSFHAGLGRYQARITINRKRISLGYYETLDAAVAARKKAEATI